MIRICNSV